jgi:tripeptidyl-peptidase I
VELCSPGGTSASTPIFASVVNRLNEERLYAGKSPIGFLNPSLYANPSMLNNIKYGKRVSLIAGYSCLGTC